MNNSATSLRDNELVRRTAVFVLSVIVVFTGSFETGRWTQRVANRRQLVREPMVSSTSVSNKKNHSDRVDFEKVLIGNAANVGFAELYDTVRSAPAEKHMQWVNQLNSMPDGAQRTAALTSFYKTFVQIDPSAAASSVDMLSDVDTKLTAAAAMVGAAPESAMPELAKMLIKLPREFVSTHSWDYLGDVFQEWSAINPEALARFFAKHPGDQLEGYHSALVYNWARLDPDSARIWLERQPERKEEELQEPFDSLVSGWFDKDRTGAENYLIANAKEKKFESSIPNVARSAFLASPTEAQAFVNRLPNDDLKKQALKEIASTTHSSGLSFADPAQPPALVANWMISFPAEDWSGSAMGDVLEAWESVDAQGLADWINRFQSGARNRLITEFCLSARQSDPNLAISLGFSITDPDLRESVLAKYAQSFGQTRSQALEEIKKSTLPPEQKKYLVKLLPSE